MSDIVYTEVGSSWCGCDGPDRWCDVCKGRLPTGAAHKEACRAIAERAFTETELERRFINASDRAARYSMRMSDLEGLLRDAKKSLLTCKNLTSHQEQSPSTVREIGVSVGKAVDEMLAVISAYETVREVALNRHPARVASTICADCKCSLLVRGGHRYMRWENNAATLPIDLCPNCYTRRQRARP